MLRASQKINEEIHCSVLRIQRKQALEHAPLAQLVEHLTLNQGVQGSSP